MRESKLVLLVAGISSIAWMLGCGEAPSVVTSSQPRASATQLGPPSPAQTIRGTDDMLSYLAERVPGGFGGLYLDEDDKLVVLLKDPSQASAAFSALVNLQRPLETRPPLTREDFRVAQAEYDFRNLREWRDAIRDVVFNVNEVVSLDIDERRNRIVVGVTSGGAESTVRQETETFRVPTDALLVEVEQPIVLTSHDLRDQDPNPPVEGGYEVDVNDRDTECTLGVNAVDTASTVYEYGFITASHCTTTMGIVDDDVAYQPKGGPRIGQEVLEPGVVVLAFGLSIRPRMPL